jgi:hypothetical protein
MNNNFWAYAQYEKTIWWDPLLALDIPVVVENALMPHPLQLSPQQMKAAFQNQLNATVEALKRRGERADEIQDVITQATSLFEKGDLPLVGGNFDFPGKLAVYSTIDLKGCVSERCNVQGIGTLDFSHKQDDTFHLDTANPWDFPGGTLLHVLVDLFLGNIYYEVIPRPWP